MTLYDNIQLMEPFFHSIRKHQSFIIIDIKLPESWTYKSDVVGVKETIGVKDNGIKGGKRFLSFFSKQTDSDIDLSVTTILSVVNGNQEREDKERLLQEKIIELKRRFETNDLDSLKGLHFEVSKETEVSGMEEEMTDTKETKDESDRLVGERN